MGSYGPTARRDLPGRDTVNTAASSSPPIPPRARFRKRPRCTALFIYTRIKDVFSLPRFTLLRGSFSSFLPGYVGRQRRKRGWEERENERGRGIKRTSSPPLAPGTSITTTRGMLATTAHRDASRKSLRSPAPLPVSLSPPADLRSARRDERRRC